MDARRSSLRDVTGLLGILLLYSALTGGWRTEEEKNVTPDRPALLWIGAGLVLNVLLIGNAGFTIASVILFVCVARGFGSKAIMRDAAMGGRLQDAGMDPDHAARRRLQDVPRRRDRAHRRHPQRARAGVT